MTAKTKEFMTALVEELTSFNEETEDDYCSDPLDIPYLVAPLFQSIKKCTDFINCIERHNYNICSYEEDKTGGYTNGRIKVVVYKLDSDGMDYYDSIEDYCYYIEFRQENPSLGDVSMYRRTGRL